MPGAPGRRGQALRRNAAGGCLPAWKSRSGRRNRWDRSATISARCARLRQAHRRAAPHRGLMEERSVTARELHDSLAQSLSYLKIQVIRLKSHLDGNGTRTQIADVLDDLKVGLNNAYRQLRNCSRHSVFAWTGAGFPMRCGRRRRVLSARRNGLPASRPPARPRTDRASRSTCCRWCARP